MKKTVFLFIFCIIATGNAMFAQTHPDFKIAKQIPTTAVESQDRTGTCWDFATVSFLETEALRSNPTPPDLSEMFIVYNIYREKAQNYIRLHGKANFGEGGQAHDAVDAIKKYGIVPKEVYTGLKKNCTIHDHSELESALKAVLDLTANNEKKITQDWKISSESLLTGHLGTLPENFTYKGKTYNPQSFAKEQLALNFDDYIEITSYTHHPYYMQFDLEIPDNWAHKEYYNVPVEDLIKIMDFALQNGYSVDWDGDVSEPGFNHNAGKAEISDSDKKAIVSEGIQNFRQTTFDNYTTTDDHLMHITGLASDNNNVPYYLTKNSWGTNSNAYGGYLYMSSDYVKLKTVAIMINKKAVPEEIAKKLGLK